MRIDPRHERNCLSVKNLKILLSLIISEPASYVNKTDLRLALNSQGSLAKLALPDRSIFPSSTNTLKRIAAHVFKAEGGFEFLDALRISAKKSISYSENLSAETPKNSRADLIEKNSELKIENQRCKQDCWLLSVAFQKSMAQGRNYALQSGNKGLIDLCEQEQMQLRSMFSLVKNVYG